MKKKIIKFLSIISITLFFVFIPLTYINRTNYNFNSYPIINLSKNIYNEINSHKSNEKFNKNLPFLAQWMNNEDSEKPVHYLSKNSFNADQMFKVYKNGKYQTSNNQFLFSNIISAKISGLPKNDLNQIIIQEINFLNSEGKMIDYNITNIKMDNKYLGENFSEKIITGEKDNNYNLNDGLIDTELVIDKKDSPEYSTEINFKFKSPQEINDIKMFLNLQSSSAEWNKIGSIELLDIYGNVYRKDSLIIDNIIDSNDPVQNDSFNLKRKLIIMDDNNVLNDQTIEDNPGTLNSYTKTSSTSEFTILKNIKIDDDNNQKKFIINIDASNADFVESNNTYLEDNKWATYANNASYKNYFKNSFSKIMVTLNKETINNDRVFNIGPLRLKNNNIYSMVLKWKLNADNTWNLVAKNPTSLKITGDNKDDGLVRFNIPKDLNPYLWEANDVKNHYISIKKNTIMWDKYTKDIPPKINDRLFMYSYDSSKDNLGTEETIYFTNSSDSSRSIVPIFSADLLKILIWEEKTNRLKKLININNELSVAELTSFLKAFSDSGLYQSFKQNLKIKDKNVSFDNLISLMASYNIMIKENPSSQVNLRFFTLNVNLNGDGVTSDTTNLNLLKYLAKLYNINKIVFHISGQLKTKILLSLENFNWLSKLPNIENVRFDYGDEDFGDHEKLRLNTYGDLKKTKWIGNPIFKYLDLRWHTNTSNESIIKILEDQNYFSNLPFGFKLLISIAEFNKLSDNDKISIHSRWIVKKILKTDEHSHGYNYVELSKKSVPTMPSPKVIFDKKQKKYIFTKINVNNKEVSAFVDNGELYWNYKSLNINPKEIRFSDQTFKNFYTDKYVEDNGLSSTVFPVSPGSNHNSELVISEPPDPTLLSIRENKTTNIDGEIYYHKIMDEVPFINSNLSKIKFIVKDKTSSNEYMFFTSLDKAFEHYSTSEISDLEIYSYNWNSASKNDDVYNDYQDNKINLDFTSPNKEDKNAIYIDDVLFNKIIIIAGKFYWDLEGAVNLSDIKYRSDDTHFYTTLFDQEGSLISGISSMNLVDDYPSDIKNLPAVIDPGYFMDINQVNEKIEIDNENYDVIVNENNLYYNYIIENIKYAYYNGEKITKYYSALNKIGNDINFDGIYTVDKARKRDVPLARDLYKIPASEDYILSISVDGILYKSYYDIGIWKWDIPNKISNNIKFVDQNGNYYTKISKEIINDKLLSSVEVTTKTSPYEPNHHNFPIIFSEDVDLLNNDFYSNGEKYSYIVKDSKIYLPDEIYKSAVFFYFSENGTYNFYSSLNQIEPRFKGRTWSLSKTESNNEIGDYLGEKIPDPNSGKFSNLKVYNNGVLNLINVLDINGKKYYANIDGLIQKIKWIDKSANIYYTNANDLPDSNNIQSINIDDISIESFVKELGIIFEDIDNKNKRIILTISIGITSSIIVLSAIIIGINTIYKRKGKLWK